MLTKKEDKRIFEGREIRKAFLMEPYEMIWDRRNPKGTSLLDMLESQREG